MIMRLSVPLHRLEEARFAFRSRLWGISLVILVVAGGISLLFFRTVSRRIARLKEFSRRVADGDFRPLPMENSKDELADLSRTLGQTAVKLDRTIKTLTEERNQSAAVLASMEEGVAVIGNDQRMIYCNDAFCRDASIANVSCEGRPVMELIRHSDLLSMIQKALAGSEAIHGEVVVGSIRTRSLCRHGRADLLRRGNHGRRHGSARHYRDPEIGARAARFYRQYFARIQNAVNGDSGFCGNARSVARWMMCRTGSDFWKSFANTRCGWGG